MARVLRAIAAALSLLACACGRSDLSTDLQAPTVAPDGSLGDDGSGTGDAGSDVAFDSTTLDGRATQPDGAPISFDAGPDVFLDAPADDCGPCLGCCQGSMCVGPSDQTNAVCGLFGATCHACETGSYCGKAGCVRPQPRCGPGNCAGCCTSQLDCAEGTQGDACGFAGQACQGCPGSNKGTGSCVPRLGGGGACNAQRQCDPSNCNGCCLGDECVIGVTDPQCGSGGAACGACAKGQTCVADALAVGGVCRFPPFCSYQNCSTCCVGDQCMPGNTSTECGKYAQSCESCNPGGWVCVDNQCAPPCAANNCAGCCDGNVCAVGTQAIACGTGGIACVDCKVNRETCTAGACQPGPGG